MYCFLKTDIRKKNLIGRRHRMLTNNVANSYPDCDQNFVKIYPTNGFRKKINIKKENKIKGNERQRSKSNGSKVD